MRFRIQRFKIGDPFYSTANLTNNDSGKGFIGTDKSCFGQMIGEDGKILAFTLERLSTLITEGEYNYSLYFSPSNNRVVILLHDIPGFEFIEIHIGNWWYNAKGCTLVGERIDLKIPMLIGSKDAHNKLMEMITSAYPEAVKSYLDKDGKLITGTILGTIIYETLNLEI